MNRANAVLVLWLFSLLCFFSLATFKSGLEGGILTLGVWSSISALLILLIHMFED